MFIVSASLASTKNIQPWEKSLLLSIYRWPAFLHWPALVITQLGSAWMLVLVSVLLLLGHKRSQWWGQFVLINGVITYAIVQATKSLIARPRPAELISSVHQLEPFVRGFGFPSGHTAIATAISLTILPFLSPRWRWLPIVWILLVGLSRIYLGVHAPLDVIGGFAIGLGVISVEGLFRVRYK